MNITPIYAALFGLFFVALSVRTLRLRRKLGVAIGDSDQAVLLRASRVHSNFAEYVPITLLLLFFLENQLINQGTSGLWIHGLCLLLLVGRIIHAVGVSQVDEDYRWRTLGMALTFMTINITAIWILLTAVL